MKKNKNKNQSNNNNNLIDNYKIIKKIGKSSWMANLFSVEDSQNNQKYILKKLLDSCQDEIFTKSFENYYYNFKDIKHHNLQPPLKVSIKQNTVYLLFDFIEGINLDTWIIDNKAQKDDLTNSTFINSKSYLKKIKNIIKQVSSALSFLHENDITHENLKSSNILISTTDNRVFVLDYGWADLIKEQTTSIKSTDDFRPADLNNLTGIQLDIYALGMLSFYMLTGYHPDRHPDLSKLSLANKNIAKCIFRSLLKDKHQSYTSVIDFSDDLIQHIDKVINPIENKQKEYVSTEKYKANLDKSYEFIIDEDNSPKPYYITLDEKENPIKLGDGTYGLVLLVNNGSSKFFALKLLYQKQHPINNRNWVITPYSKQSMFKHYKNPEDSKLTINDEKRDKVDKNIESLNKKDINDFKNFFNQLMDLEDLEQEHKLFLLDKTINNPQCIALERFEKEMHISGLLTEKECTIELGGAFGVIRIKGGTDAFIASSACKTLNNKNIFEKMGVEVSNYALIMDKYNWTLKEILEFGPGIYKKEVNGYKVLESMSFYERISTMLPFLINIANGLKTMHAIGLYHHDIKPSNIFIKKNTIENSKKNEKNNKNKKTNKISSIECVIGDLGFLETDILVNQTLTNIEDVIPRGTRHFRSPEQKDYFDICDVKVCKNKDLQTNDPKFIDSIIEKGDFLVFCKDSQAKPYIIDEITKESYCVTIKLKDNTDIPEDKRTQVKMYKRPKERTDLFGFGAIVFDMLTCGKSPEFFYDTIRSYDTDHSTECITDVTTILDMYKQVSAEQINDPALLRVFEPFRHNITKEYAPYEIVELILKCLFYKAKNTYYNIAQKEMDSYNDDTSEISLPQAAKMIYDDLEKLCEKSICSYAPKYQSNNHLLLGETFEDIDDNKKPDFANRIFELRNQKNIPLRLAHGYWYINRLIHLVLDQLVGSETKFFREMLPESINITMKNSNNTSRNEPTESSVDNKKKIKIYRDCNLSLEHTTYDTIDKYKIDLITNHIYNKISQNILNHYVPLQMSFMRRSIKLFLPEEGATGSYSYQFKDRSIFGNALAENDWIVQNPCLWKVSKTNEDGTISILYDGKLDFYESGEAFFNKKGEGKSLPTPDINTEILYYKNLVPCKYYLQMLGTYIYHIFFLKQYTDDQYLITLIAQIFEQIQNRKDNNVDFLGINNTLNSSSDEQIDDIYKKITHLFIKTTFSDIQNSFYKTEQNERKILSKVLHEINKLRDEIAKLLKIDPPEDLDTNLDEIECIIEKVDIDNDYKPDFEKMILELMDIKLPNTQELLKTEKEKQEDLKNQIAELEANQLSDENRDKLQRSKLEFSNHNINEIAEKLIDIKSKLDISMNDREKLEQERDKRLSYRAKNWYINRKKNKLNN